MRMLRRLGITLLGGFLLALGGVLLVLPGPGLLVVAAGLLVLGLEYEWARSRARQIRDKAWGAARQVSVSRWSSAGAIVGALGLVAAGIAWGVVDALPASSWWTGGSLIGGGLVSLGTVVAALFFPPPEPTSRGAAGA